MSKKSDKKPAKEYHSNSFVSIQSHFENNSKTNFKKTSSKEPTHSSLLSELLLSSKETNKIHDNWNQILDDSGLPIDIQKKNTNIQSDDTIYTKTAHQTSKKSAICKPLYLRNGTLYIQCHSSLIRNHIRVHKEKLISACNKHSNITVYNIKTVHHNNPISTEFPEKNQHHRDNSLSKTASKVLPTLESSFRTLEDGPLKQSLERMITTLKKKESSKPS